jgi:hypothetical protein
MPGAADPMQVDDAAAAAAGAGAGAGAGPSSSKQAQQKQRGDPLVERKDAPWVEKYRPKTLDDVAAHKEIIDTSECGAEGATASAYCVCAVVCCASCRCPAHSSPLTHNCTQSRS